MGRTKCPWECHAGIPAVINALSSKIAAKNAPRAVQNPVRSHPEPCKNQPGGTHGSPDATKSAREAVKRWPTNTLERPRIGQERPRQPQDRPRRRPNPSKNKPGEPHDAFLAGSTWAAGFERLVQRFFAISGAVRNACEACSDPLKLWFCCIQSTGTAQARIQHKTLKNNAW